MKNYEGATFLPLKPINNKNIGQQNVKIPGYHCRENQQKGKYKSIKWIQKVALLLTLSY